MQKALLSILLLATLTISAQPTGIAGTVQDASTGESLPGAIVLLEPAGKAAATDIDGRFAFHGLPSGKFTITVSYISYTTKSIKDVVVPEAGVTHITVNLETAGKQDLQEVVITARADRETNVALTLQQKNAASVSDGISAESIRRTPDRNTGDVLKRVSGATLQDNKFAIIRGLSDRYNSAMINGVTLPSSESDRKAFAFDIFPAVMLENLIVVKSATPDMPADFAGGVIKVNTKSIPERSFQSLSLGGSYHSLTTFRDISSYQGGKTDWLGFDDGTRALPVAIPETKAFERLSADEKALLAKELHSNWKVKTSTALPGLSFQYAAGRKMTLGKKEAGFTFAYTYQNSVKQFANIRREFEESKTGVVQRSELNDQVNTSDVLNSAVLNMAVTLNENNRLSLKNIYSINSGDRLNVRNGIREMDNDPNLFEKSWNYWFTSNRIYSGQLQGEHQIAGRNIKMTWVAGTGNGQNSIPNMRRLVYQKTDEGDGDTDNPFVAVVQNNGTIPTAAGNMFWSDTHDDIHSLSYDISLPLSVKSVTSDLKAGGLHQLRYRDFSARSLGYSRYRKTTRPPAPFDHELLLLEPESIFDPAHMGLQANGLGGFKLEEATKVHDSYTASSVMNAGFIMTDSRVSEKVRVVLGARLESYAQRFEYVELGSNRLKTIDTTISDVLPSVNLIYSVSQRANLRLSWSQTVSRPEFRELAPFQFYNFAADNIISGSPRLKRALINNADARYEIFPGYGQLFSVSAFYKHFRDPVELYMRTGTSGAPELSYTNVPSAVSYGAELEYRHRLLFLTKNDSTGFLANTTLVGNLALIRSLVSVGNISGAANRPLQGQSPFIINAGILYSHPERSWQASMFYNLAGERIFIVGNVQEPDVWEKGRHVVDFQVSKTFGDRFDIRLNIKDLFAQRALFYQNSGDDPKFDASTDNPWQETTFGQTVTMSVVFRIR